MTAIDRLRAAFESQLQRNVDPHGELILVGVSPQDGRPLEIKPERESWQDDDAGDDEIEYLTLFDMQCVFDEIRELMARPPVEQDASAIETDPQKRYLQILEEWKGDKIKLAYYKEQEKEKRMILFAGAFPNPVEGTNKYKLPDGRTIKASYKINRKIDEAALPAVLEGMRAANVPNTDALIVRKPTLAKREWNGLTPDNKLLFSAAIIATPGTPTLDLELPKALK